MMGIIPGVLRRTRMGHSLAHLRTEEHYAKEPYAYIYRFMEKRNERRKRQENTLAFHARANLKAVYLSFMDLVKLFQEENNDLNTIADGTFVVSIDTIKAVKDVDRCISKLHRRLEGFQLKGDYGTYFNKTLDLRKQMLQDLASYMNHFKDARDMFRDLEKDHLGVRDMHFGVEWWYDRQVRSRARRVRTFVSDIKNFVHHIESESSAKKPNLGILYSQMEHLAPDIKEVFNFITTENSAMLKLMFETRDETGHIGTILSELKSSGYPSPLLSDLQDKFDTLAKHRRDAARLNKYNADLEIQQAA